MVRRLTIVLVVLGVMLSAGAASAHDPLFLTSDQTTPESGPLLPDGTISFAIYGDLAGGGDTRGLQVVFDEGDRLLVEVLIPALLPEADLADDQLPVATVVAPDGSETTLVPRGRDRFDEPFSSTSYFRLARLDGEAQEGVYDITVTGTAAARFTVAVGTIETFLTPVERVENRATSFDEITEPLAEWYAGTGTTIEATADPEPTPEATVEAPTPTPAPEPTAAPTEAAADPSPTAEVVEAAPADDEVAAPPIDTDRGRSVWPWVLGLGAIAVLGSAIVVVRR